MSGESSLPFEAVVFDLDGVLTDTASVHLRAWTETFDDFLSERTGSESFRPFDRNDYAEFVDGRPRYEGVASFLESRGITLAPGDRSDPPGWQTICALGNRKNQRFHQLLESDGVEVLPGTLDLLDALRGRGVGVGVATASRNARAVLAAAGITEPLDALIDGEAAAEMSLRGKPEPDTLVAAARLLGANPDRCVLVEDALAGIQAAVAGGFGMVVGVSPRGESERLRSAEADVVIRDLSELDVGRIERWFSGALEEAQWSVEQHGFDPEAESHWETLCSVGNGWFATRGAAEEARAGRPYYPGTYRAGLFNRLDSRLGGRELSHEDMVNLPNWLPVRFRVGDGDWLDLGNVEIIDFRRRLDLRRGELAREVVLRDAAGRTTRLESRRFASMDDPRMAGLRYRVEPLDYQDTVTLRSGLDAGVVNAGVARYSNLEGRHLDLLERGGTGNTVWLSARTIQSGIEIAQVARSRFRHSGETVAPDVGALIEDSAIFSVASAELGPGDSISVEKTVGIHTSLDCSGASPLTEARESLDRAPDLAALEAASRRAWEQLWSECDIEIEGDRSVERLLRFNAYHLLITAGPHHSALDAGIPARGLHGEGYRGHIFWDEMFVLPFYLLRLPETARSALLYRCRRLEAARGAAAAEGTSGALFPWQSASTGTEETPMVHLNPTSGEWAPDHSRLQRHVSLAIAYNVWRYLRATGDLDFLAGHGAEVMVEIARYWVDLCDLDPERGRYSIAGVMGPDEFHEGYPGAADPGLTDNAHTALMVSWLLAEVPVLLRELAPDRRTAVRAALGLGEPELELWTEIAGRLSVRVSSDGVLEQFAGFFELEELDWERYRSRLGDVARLDRILGSEGDSPNRYQAIKQADALMPFYLLPDGDLDEVLERLGLPQRRELLEKTFAYYFPRTSHGSTLSALVHGRLATRLENSELARRLFGQTLRADYDDVQGGTTGEGIHTGPMAGSILWVLEELAGVDVSGDRLSLNPRLPDHWRRLGFKVRHRGALFGIEITPETLRLELLEGRAPRGVVVRGSVVEIGPGERREIALA
ncbi:MAG: beta-phosphoglucomutase family hydrolase [Thermoanaerobaculia bacterium]